MIVRVDVAPDGGIEALDGVEAFRMEEFLSVAKKLSIGALSRQLPLRDMLCARPLASGLRWNADI